MEVRNHTPFVWDTLLHARREAGLFLTLIIKATFEILPDRTVRTASDQRPVNVSPVYTDTEEEDPLLELESDRIPLKPRTDIAVVGNVYAPDGKPASALYAMLRVGTLRKTIAVFGDRQWEDHANRASISSPLPFTSIPLTYTRAYGGVDLETGRRFAANPAGCGYVLDKAHLDGTRLPNFEDIDQPIRSWTDQPRPAGFGFMDGAWQPRCGYAGKLDVFEEWGGTVLMPPDFAEEFYNAAHPDLQAVGYLRGDEVVEMQHLTPEGFLHFALPGVRPILRVTRYAEAPDSNGAVTTDEGVTQTIATPLDTVVFYPDEGLFCQVWRGQCPIRTMQLDEIAHLTLHLDDMDID